MGLPKTKTSRGPVPLHPLLAGFMLGWQQTTMYSQPGDWVFPSFKLKGQKPRVANMLVADYLRPAAVKAGILSAHRNDQGKLVDATHGDSAFILCVTALPRFSSESRPIRKRCRHCCATVM